MTCPVYGTDNHREIIFFGPPPRSPADSRNHLAVIDRSGYRLVSSMDERLGCLCYGENDGASDEP